MERPVSSADPTSVPVLPTLLQDVIDTADKWNKSGRIDPFTEIYNVGLTFYLESVLSFPF